MIALLNDLSYIPPNNEQNEPTQGDICETSNESTQAKCNEFEELYASANEELYIGCDYVTRLDFMAKFTYFKVIGKLTDSIFNEMLEFFQHVFPTMKGYKLPPSYYAIKKTFKMISNTPRKKVPKKVLRYFLIIPRLQRLYKSSRTAKEMTWHATGKCTEPGKMQHPVDGRAWKNFDTKYLNFAKDPRNVRLRLAADGFNPFDIDVYLRPLIDDLKVLWALKGVETIDVATGQKLDESDDHQRSKLPDGFGSNFKQKVTDNDTNKTGLKSHGCHTMMQRLLPYGLQQYLPDEVAKPIIELCSFFKQICSATLMEDDMLKSQNNDPGVSATSELFALACGPTPTPISVNSCVVNGVRFVLHSRDERRTTQNNGIYSLGGKDEEMYYGQLQEILEFSYFSFKVVLFRVKWFDTSNKGRKVKHLVLRNNMTQILTKGEAFKEEDPDVIHFNNSFDLLFSTSLNDLDNATLHIDGQSTKVDAPPDIIDLDEDDDIINDEEALPYDLADSDDVDFVNVDDDDGVDMSADVARGHGDDGSGDDPPPSYNIPTSKGTRKPNLGTKPESLKIAKTRQRAWSSASKDPGHLLAFEIRWVLPGRATDLLILPPSPPPQCTHNSADVEKLKNKNKYLTKQVNLMMKLFRSDDKFSQMLNQYESTPEFGNASGSGGCGDDEMADDEDDSEDDEDEEDGDS
uniref:DUF4216 domain-containing protein n=1 Tax=Tanacetum cinerariifolium TaxID=118510 RepID=A0A699HDJ5_TANCI|nr:hypothetical protein [Tanacetum cinerariifolium]